MKKKYKVVIAIFIVIILFVICYLFGVYRYHNKIEKIKSDMNNIIVNKELNLEYGDKLSYNDIIGTYIDKDNLNKNLVKIYINNKEVLENTEYTFNKVDKYKIDIEVSTMYVHKFILKHKEKIVISKSFSIGVVDTNLPVLNGISDKMIYVGDSIDLKAGISASDKIDGKLEFTVSGDVDTNTAGKYTVNVSTADKNGNVTTAKFVVKVKNREIVRSGSSSKIITGNTTKGYKIENINGAYYINGILVANKTYGLSNTYAPGGLLQQFKNNFYAMQSDAKNAGINLKIISGYRSYSTQNVLYNQYVARDGKTAADTYSARPGYSEHQTGLAADINSLYQTFINTKEGKWLNDNCYKYGFIIRYPRGKENITGYMYEPWHIRYVSVEVATVLYNNGNWLTLEEYLGIDSKYNF